MIIIMVIHHVGKSGIFQPPLRFFHGEQQKVDYSKEKQNEKFTVLMLVLALAAMLVACSSAPDRQPAIDAYNQASDAFNEAAILINDNLELVSPELVEKCNEISGLLDQYSELLSGDDEIPQENLDEMTAWLDDTTEWAIAAKDEIETGLAQLG